jgi:Protein of unknown function (DUF664)
MRPRPSGGGWPGAGTVTEPVIPGAVLDHARAAVLTTARAVPPDLRGEPLVLPDVSLLAIVEHLRVLEQAWFAFTFAGIEPSPRWGGGDDRRGRWPFDAADRAATVLSAYRAECDRSRGIAARAGPGAISVRPAPTGGHVSLEWIVLQMVAETSRHAGQADVLRRLIDGSAGPPPCGIQAWWP